MRIQTTTALPLLALGALGALGAPCLALAAPTPPPIDSVVVFSDRAEVTRAGEATCADGTATLKFEPLPMSLDERTLRATASGKARALGVTSRVLEAEGVDDTATAKLDRRIEALEDELAASARAVEAVTRRTQVTNGYAGYFSGLAGEDMRGRAPDLGRWTAALDRVRREREAGGKRLVELAAAERALGRQLDLLQRQRSKMDVPTTPERRSAEVVVECGPERTPEVRLSYVVPHAQWRPEYDVRFLPAKKSAKVGDGKVEVTVGAVVQQSTGEDWTRARIVLSTAKPRLGSEAPYPAPLRVRGVEADEKRVLVDAQEKRDRIEGEAGGEGRAPADANLQDKGRSFSLAVARRVSVAADGRPYWMPVDVTTGPATARLVTIPKLRPYVYQVLALKNPAAYPMLQGRIHAFRGGSFVGDAQMEYAAPGEPMELSLGIDAEVKVARTDIASKDKKAGVFSSTKTMERSYRVTVKNTGAAAVPVEVRESIPVSKVEDVKVTLRQGAGGKGGKGGTTPGYQLDAHRGFVTWTVTAEPTKEHHLDLAYSIKLPEDWDVRMR